MNPLKCRLCYMPEAACQIAQNERATRKHKYTPIAEPALLAHDFERRCEDMYEELANHEELKDDFEKMKARAEKAEAEVARLQTRLKAAEDDAGDNAVRCYHLNRQAKDAEALLERAEKAEGALRECKIALNVMVRIASRTGAWARIWKEKAGRERATRIVYEAELEFLDK